MADKTLSDIAKSLKDIDFVMLNTLHETNAAKAAVAQAINVLSQALHN